MSTVIPRNLGAGASFLNRKLRDILDGFVTDLDLAHLKVTQVTGANAATAITLTGILTTDRIIMGIQEHGLAKATPAQESPFSTVLIPTKFTISDADEIKISVDTSDDLVTVLWIDKSLKNIQKA